MKKNNVNSIFILVILLLSGCRYGSAYWKAEKAAWEKHGDCATICDYVQGYMSTSNQLNQTQCHCYTPQLRDFAALHPNSPLDKPEVTVTCKPDCKTRALSICAHQPWRCPEY